ncbi:MAG: protein translocase subunit SecDF [Bacteroidetes bacterium]|nr:MAG: protein translocase subunit SecDF [Bacteroidota bacterium]
MQNKGVIRLFAIVFAVVCLWELSFTYFANQVENDATEVAAGDAERKQNYLDSMLTQEVYSLGFESMTYTYAEVKDRELNLGLDLRGGMNVIMEVSVRDILHLLADDTQDPMFMQALARTDSASTSSQDAYVDLFFQEFDAILAKSGGVRKYADPGFFGTQRITERIGFNATNDQVKTLVSQYVSDAVDEVYTVLKARIDQFGVIQPNVQRLEGSGRILVELPGVKDPDRVKEILQQTARLEFWKAYKAYEIGNYLSDVNERLRGIVEVPEEFKKAVAAQSAADSTDGGFDASEFAGIEEDSTGEATEVDSAAAMAEADSLQNMFNPIWTIFSPNLDQNNSWQAGPFIGYAQVKDTALINSYLRMPEIRSLLPAQFRYVKWAWNRPTKGSNFVGLVALAGNRDNSPELEGDVITDARQDFDQMGRPNVSIAMNAVGSNLWKQLTGRLAEEQDIFDVPGHPSQLDGNGKRGYIAITLDGVVYSAPSVNSEIPGGRTEISGSFTVEEAKDLATVLRAGKLPVPTHIVQSEVVGPTLGEEAIRASFNSFLIALIVVMLYMILYYNFAGIVADISLILNMLFIFGMLASMKAVLTLPGMAGIVLTIGMAVDANVIIYERIREELSNGKDVRLAIRDGYKYSYSAIIDANLTTLITAIILYVFGTGPIRGFATTLIIGILSSLFCAIFVTRLVYEWRLSKKAKVTFSTKFSDGWMKNVNFDIIGKRKTAYVISAILIVISLGSLFTKGLNQGVDFVGGRSYTIRFDQPVDITEIGESVGAQLVDEDGEVYTPIVKTLGESSQIVLTTKYKVAETGVDAEIQHKVYEGVKGFFKTPVSEEVFMAQGDEAIGLVASRQVGPTIADDIERDAFWAVLFSLLAIFLYILIRFSKWQYSLGAVAALLHDVIIVFGIFSIFDGVLPFQLEVDQAFVAAILTVIGYSLNDTVVVFDRVREYFGHYHKKRAMSSILNSAMNGTLSRTVNTSMTTMVVLLIILFFGGDSIRGFIFAITVGVLVGTYSSLFVATPVMFDATKSDKEDDK